MVRNQNGNVEQHAITKSIVLFCLSFLIASTSYLGMPALRAVAAPTPSDPIVISGQNGTVITGLKITSSSGDCVKVINSTNVTIKESDIGPCAGNGIYISGGTGNNVFDNFIHVESAGGACCDTHDNVKIVDGSTFVTVQGNVLVYSETNVFLYGVNHVTINGNFMHNPLGPFPRGQNYLSDTVSNVTVTNNYAYSCVLSGSGLAGVPCPLSPIYRFSERQEDSINFYKTDTFTAQNNYVVGGHSASGCGLIADLGANNGTFRGNIVSNSGQCGIGIATGMNHIVDANKILNLDTGAGGGEVGLSIWNQYPSACGPIQVSNNISEQKKASGIDSGYWNGGGCTGVTLTNNTFDQAAYNILYPMSSTNPPFPIPPLPRRCAAVSPYTTNASMPLCDGSATGGTIPAAPTELRVLGT